MSGDVSGEPVFVALTQVGCDLARRLAESAASTDVANLVIAACAGEEALEVALGDAAAVV